MPRTFRPALVTLSAAALLLAACAPADETETAAPTPAASDGTAPASPAAAECARESLDLTTDGVLTVATDQPAYAPWFVDNDPSNGKGYESAVAYAVAEELGFSEDEVEWTRVRFDRAIAPGPKEFDFDINQVSINEDRRQAVDFSSPYFDVTQAVITTADNPAAGATSIAELQDLKIGAQVGTTSLTAINEVIEPTTDPAVFNTNDDAKLALETGQVDAIVVDLPTAFYITAAELENGKIVGQLPPTTGEQEHFGLVLDKGSPLTECVSQAVDALREDGTLEALQQEWLAQSGAPVLQ